MILNASMFLRFYVSSRGCQGRWDFTCECATREQSGIGVVFRGYRLDAGGLKAVGWGVEAESRRLEGGGWKPDPIRQLNQ